MTQLCETLELSRATYYRWRKRRQEPTDGDAAAESGRNWQLPASLRRAIRDYALAQPILGHRKVWAPFRDQLSRTSVYRILREAGLLLPSNWTEQVRQQAHEPGRLSRLTPDGPNQVWQCDITWVWVEGYGWHDAIDVVDGATRYALVTHFRAHQRTEEVIEALDAALAEAERFHELPESIVLVTDNGLQLRSIRFLAYLEDRPFDHIRIQRGAPEQIGRVERFHESLKYEEIYRNDYADPIEARDGIASYRAWYNWERPHQALDYGVPGEAYCERSGASPLTSAA